MILKRHFNYRIYQLLKQRTDACLLSKELVLFMLFPQLPTKVFNFAYVVCVLFLVLGVIFQRQFSVEPSLYRIVRTGNPIRIYVSTKTNTL